MIVQVKKNSKKWYKNIVKQIKARTGSKVKQIAHKQLHGTQSNFMALQSKATHGTATA